MNAQFPVSQPQNMAFAFELEALANLLLATSEELDSLIVSWCMTKSSLFGAGMQLIQQQYGSPAIALSGNMDQDRLARMYPILDQYFTNLTKQRQIIDPVFQRVDQFKGLIRVKLIETNQNVPTVGSIGDALF